VFSIIVIQTPTLGSLLHLKSLHLNDWIAVFAGSLLAAALPLVFRARASARRPGPSLTDP